MTEEEKRQACERAKAIAASVRAAAEEDAEEDGDDDDALLAKHGIAPLATDWNEGFDDEMVMESSSNAPRSE